MALILIIIILVLLYVVIIKHKKILHMEEELSYMTGKLNEILKKEECGYILIPSEQKEIKEIAAKVNQLLEQYYNEQTKHKKSELSLMRRITNISHDLRTPLTVLRGYTEILQKRAKTIDIPDEVSQLILKLSQKTSESVRIVIQFFEMTKLESGDVVFEIQKINICTICREIFMEYYDILMERRYTVDISIPEKPIYINADKNACIRILKNIIDNAIKHGGAGKFLGIKIQETGDQIVIGIEDQGKGIDERQKELIFNRTYMQEKKEDSYFNSSGLGLSISKGLANRMGAEINVNSKPWKNTVFTILFKKLEKS